MKRAEFIVCSLAFHAALLVAAVLMPPPFPSVREYTATDLTYVEVRPVTPEDVTETGAAMPSYSGPSFLERLTPPSPGVLSLKEMTFNPGGYAGSSAAVGMHAAAQAQADAGSPGEDSQASMQEVQGAEAHEPGPAPALNAESDEPRTAQTQQSTDDASSETEDSPVEGAATAVPAEDLTVQPIPIDDALGITTGRKSINFKYQAGWPDPAAVRVDVNAGQSMAAGGGQVWYAAADRDWIFVTPDKGKGPGGVDVGVFASVLDVGYHEGAMVLVPDGREDDATKLPVSVMVLPEDPGTPELPHFAWDDYMDGGCGVCHLPKELMPSADFMSRPEFCGLCHSTAGIASSSVPRPGGHPVMVNVTSGGARLPSGGTVDEGPYSDRMATHLLEGDKVVCVTCHNVMYKPGDYGRSWELTATSDNRTFSLAKGGWSKMGYLVPKVYVTRELAPMPDKLSGVVDFLAARDTYQYDEKEGTVTFNKPLQEGSYVYVTLSSPYLRAPTANGELCYDCHSQNTHQRLGCLVCHTAHGTSNIKGIRGHVRTGGGKEFRVVFRSYSGYGSFADAGPNRDGICEACHKFAAGGALHNGRDYSGADCTKCHSHADGFGL